MQRFAVSSRFLLCLTTAFCGICAAWGEDAPPEGRMFAVVAFGDSTTAPRTVDGKALRVYCDVIRDRFEAAGIEARVVNAGVPADTTARGRKRFKHDVLQSEPDLVVIQFGLNDSCIDVHKGKVVPRVPMNEYAANLRYFIDTLRRRGSKVILMTQNPMFWREHLVKLYGKPPYDVNDRWGFNLLNTDYVETVRGLAAKREAPLVDIYRMYEDYDKGEGQQAEDLLLDGIHPNEKGHALLAELLWTEISKLNVSGLGKEKSRGRERTE